MSIISMPTASTGPRTAEGKAISSQNAVKSGLFTAADFIRPGEQSTYDEARNQLINELKPDGYLEFAWIDEMMSATWRLRRCRIIEADLATRTDEYFNLSEADEK